MSVAAHQDRYQHERVFIVGAGVVGTAMARGFLRLGHNVTLVDILPSRVEALVAEGFDARNNLDLRDERSGYVFLALPTPSKGRRYNLNAFEDGARAVGRAIAMARDGHIVVVSSTVPPGTTEDLIKPLLERYSGKKEGVAFFIAYSPEFLRSASAAEDFANPLMITIGATSTWAQERLATLMVTFGGELRLFDNPRVAEMIKCAHNLFNATKISFWNQIWLVCQRLGIEADDVADTVARSAEGSINPLYGIRGGRPFDGKCLPKDTFGFLGFGDDCNLPLPMIEAVVHINEIMKDSEL